MENIYNLIDESYISPHIDTGKIKGKTRSEISESLMKFKDSIEKQNSLNPDKINTVSAKYHLSILEEEVVQTEKSANKFIDKNGELDFSAIEKVLKTIQKEGCNKLIFSPKPIFDNTQKFDLKNFKSKKIDLKKDKIFLFTKGTIFIFLLSLTILITL